MTDRELLQMALDALENAHANEPIWKTPIKEAIKALRSRLANEFNPDWDQIEALRESLREHMAEIQRLRARLAQPEPEPFEYWNAVEGWVKIDEVRQHFDTTNCGTIYKHEGEGRIPLYAEPPQREWVGLTDAELESIYDACDNWGKFEYERRIEAKLKEKNG